MSKIKQKKSEEAKVEKSKLEKIRKTGWGPTSAILVSLGIYLGAQIIAGYLIILYLLGSGIQKNNIASNLENSVYLQFTFILLAEAISLGLLRWFLRRRKISWRDIGVKKPSLNNILYAFPGYAIYFGILLVAFAIISNFVPSINLNQDQQVGFDNAQGVFSLSLVFMALVILPAVVEEIMVRGFLYGGLRNKLPVITSAIIASIVFATAHLQLGSGKNPLWIAAVDTFILSMVLIWLRERTGNIWAGVVVHMMKNALAFASLFIFKG